jgi:hypothetical protein
VEALLEAVADLHGGVGHEGVLRDGARG